MAAMRRASSSDIDIVRGISSEAYLPYEAAIGIVPIPAVEDYGPRIERGEVWLLEEDREAVGLAVLDEGPDHLFVYSIAVRPDLRGRGYGSVLLRFIDDKAVEIGVRIIRLYTNLRMERNIAIYLNHGYEKIGTRLHPTRPGHTLVDMTKRIGGSKGTAA
jgi:ribosomal protein S18 acetylase RimI-like enzyme